MMLVTRGCLFKAVRNRSGTLESKDFATTWSNIPRDDNQSIGRNVFAIATQELLCRMTSQRCVHSFSDISLMNNSLKRPSRSACNASEASAPCPYAKTSVAKVTKWQPNRRVLRSAFFWQEPVNMLHERQRHSEPPTGTRACLRKDSALRARGRARRPRYEECGCCVHSERVSDGVHNGVEGW